MEPNAACPRSNGVGGFDRRCQRVLLLLAGIVILSLADLVITLEHLQTIGMVEANPIAAWVIRSTHSAWILGVYKVITVGICVALLYRARRYRVGELAAWCAVAILAGLSVMWHSYSEQLESPAEVMTAQADFGDLWLHVD